MAAPEDSVEVLSALPPGWYVAEVRGRNRPGGPVPPAESLPHRQGYALPLRIERTSAEPRIEAQVVVRKLACDLGVDTMTVDRLQRNQADYIDQQAKALAAAEPSAAPGLWQNLALSIFQLDAHTQDFLAAQSGTRAAASSSAAGSRRSTGRSTRRRVRPADSGLLGFPARRATMQRAGQAGGASVWLLQSVLLPRSGRHAAAVAVGRQRPALARRGRGSPVPATPALV